ncbi:modification methylase DpnIIA [Lyngbya aestuarii BL J]|uniref:Site-specific DNA-methyltransferase (adenine-specific) n=1 Tax=Lyngbya aestuarii BL J TaxID=1348334 RepID=U7Q9X9_9CYAN|nr:DNA adenine methylase [Lyngbya aestuarii]ERT04634.1 modification methylase DpnIIA [Lyngbya aestuarii BL J]
MSSAEKQLQNRVSPSPKNPLVRPFLKWAGGKRQLLNVLKEHLPKKYKTYYEPFVGGGAFLFDLQPKNAVINDSNGELINCYRMIRDSVDELIEDLARHKNQEDYYYKMRELDRKRSFEKKTPVQRASRIIYLNKTCYNGLFRVNSRGQFNVPFGRYKNPNILDEAVLRAVSSYLNKNQVEILNNDFETAVKTARKGDFIYFDPPYDPVSDTASFTGYDINGFNRSEQERLKNTVDDLDKKGCYVLLSNAYTDFIVDLYKDYRQFRVSAIRAINSNAKKRGRVDEILVKNYE